MLTRGQKKRAKELARRKKKIRNQQKSKVYQMCKDKRQEDSFQKTIKDINSETMKMLNMFLELKRFYNSRMKYAKLKYEKDMTDENKRQLDEYTNFKDDIDLLETHIRNMVHLCTDIEEKKTMSDKLDCFIDNFSTMQETQDKFNTTIEKFGKLDDEFLNASVVKNNIPPALDVMNAPVDYEDITTDTANATDADVVDVKPE